MEIIEEINQEEKAYSLETSQYPLRKQIADKLAPYKKLYETGYEFNEKKHNWMTSKIGTFEPEEIDTDIGNYFRTVFKLEKVFIEHPAPRELATTV